MKKTISLILILTLLTFSLASCKKNDNPPAPGTLNLSALPDHDAVGAAMIKGEIDVAILPEPKATASILAAKQNGQNYSIKLNLSTEWSKISEFELAMGCLAVNNSSLSAKANEINAFLEEYEQSILYINNPDNHENAAQMIVSAGVLPKLPIAKAALTNLYGSIVYQDGAEMKSTLESFYSAIGLSLPSESFYYTPVTPTGTPTQKLTVGVMNGPTGMGMAKLINDEAENELFEFKAYSDPTIALTDLKNGTIDMACLPTNAVATASNKGLPVSSLAINCLGSLYVVVKEGVTVETVADLVGKNVYYGVPTSTTAPIFTYILTENGIEVKPVE